MSKEKEKYCECSSCGYVHLNSERTIKEGKHTKEYGLNDVVCPKCNALSYKSVTEHQYTFMTKTPEEKATVRFFRTVQTNSEKTNLIAEEKAREYANRPNAVTRSEELAYLAGYYSRDEEVKELREALKEIIQECEDWTIPLAEKKQPKWIL